MKLQLHAVRPTWRALALVITSLTLALVGALLRASVPFVGAIACLAAVAAGAITVALAPDAWLATDGHTAWERIGRTGDVVEHVASGDGCPGAHPPARRGVWRRSRAGRVGDWLWAWTRDAADAGTSEVVVAPVTSNQPLARFRLTGSPLRADDRTEVATVRRYEPGDPLRQIAWHASARHGRLMSRNLGGTEGRATVILVDVISGIDADALATAAWQLVETAHAGGRIFVSDGTDFVSASDAIRMLAQLEIENSPESPSERADAALRAVAAFTRRLAGIDSWHLVLVTDSTNGALERALRRSRLSAKCDVVHASAAQAAIGTADAARAKPQDSAAMTVATRLATCLLELLCLAIAVWTATRLVEPAAWTTLAAAGYAVCSLATSLRRRSLKPWQHVLAAIAWLAVGLVATACVAPLDVTPWDSGTPIEGATTLATYGAALVESVRQGATELYTQWVPLRIPSVSAGLALCLGTALTLPFIRLLLGSRHMRPLVATLAFAALATCERFLGTEGLTPLAAVATACGLALMALTSPGTASMPRAPRRHGRTMRMALGATTLLLTCSLGSVLANPANTALAQLGIDSLLGGSPLSATSVNPLLDLSRSLESRSDVALFSYTTSLNQPLYLRLATIDDLSGDTWKLAASADASTSASQPYDDGTPLTNTASPTPEAHAQRARTTVTRRALTSPYLPAPSNTARAVAGPNNASWTADGALATSGTPASTYTVEGLYTQPLTSSDAASQALMYLSDLYAGMNSTPASELSGYLALPDQLPSSAEDVVTAARQAGLANGTAYDGNASQRARAVMCWLLSYFEAGGFTYTTDAPDGNGSNLEMVGQFLAARRGYCTHYASALAVLGRALGVPTRIALGYAGGTRTSDGSYVATNQNLHAWCEAYIEGIGWLGFDATPGAESGAGTLGAETRAAATAAARTDVAQPSTGPSASAEEDVPEGPAATTKQDDAGTTTTHDTEPSNDSAGNPAVLLAIGGTIALSLVATAILIARRRRIRKLIACGGPGAAIASWEEACKQARHTGVTWPRSATELEIATIIKQKLATSDRTNLRSLADRAEELARAACDERYGRQPSQNCHPRAR